MAEESVAASGFRWRARRVELVETLAEESLVEADVLMMSLSYQLSHKYSAVTHASANPSAVTPTPPSYSATGGFYSVIPVALLMVHAYSKAVCFHLP